MSDDPRTDFFDSGSDPAANASPDPTDTRTDFFATGNTSAPQATSTPEPTYDAALFKKRIGRDPEPAELANFKSMKGQGWSQGNGAGSFAGLGEAALATGAGTLKALSHAANDIMPDWDSSRASVEKEIQTDPVLNYQGGPEAEQYLEGVSALMTPVTWLADKAHQGISSVFGNRAADVAGDVATLLPAGRGTLKGTWNRLVNSMDDPETVRPGIGDAPPKSMGAAQTAPDLSNLSPELRQAVANAKNVNQEAFERHVDADTLPLPAEESPLQLRKGQATGNAQQISDEKNMRADPDTQGILSQSITDQDRKLGASMGEIRNRATPDTAQRTTPEHGQTAIDSIKTQDNSAILDTRAKYKALADANGGAVPLDTTQALQGIRSALDEGFLNQTARNNPVVSEVLQQLESGRPLTFERFENARTNLADVQRGGGSDAKAAAIVRNQLENMPLSAQAANLKELADTARAAARSRFQTIEHNPAYEAAINDNVPKTQNGLHAVGAPSPLADTFMDRYFLGNGQSASRAYIQRVKGVMQNDPTFSNSIEASSLNKLRDAAGLDEFNAGSFRNASYRNARNAMNNRADVLMSPQSADWTDQLKRVSGYVNEEGKASTINRSNTALTLQRFGAQYPETPGIAGTLADYGSDIVAAHAGPVGYAVKKIGTAMVKNSKDRKAIEATRAAKLKFAQDATAPGAGLEAAPSAVIPRASGGKVDHEALVKRLMARWHQARKDTTHSTEPLLNIPDAQIIKALDIAQEHI